MTKKEQANLTKLTKYFAQNRWQLVHKVPRHTARRSKLNQREKSPSHPSRILLSNRNPSFRPKTVWKTRRTVTSALLTNYFAVKFAFSRVLAFLNVYKLRSNTIHRFAAIQVRFKVQSSTPKYRRIDLISTNRKNRSTTADQVRI